MRSFLLSLLTFGCALLGATFLATQAVAAEAGLDVRIGYLAWQAPRGPLLSNVIPEPEDAGLRGAELAIEDSNSTGRFLKQHYRLDTVAAKDPQELLSEARRLHHEGLRLFVTNVPAAELRALAEALPDSLLINAGSADDDLRRQACLGNVLHSLPSRAMLADALGQFMAARRWQRALLIVGSQPDDQLYAEALRRAGRSASACASSRRSRGASTTTSAAAPRRRCHCSPRPRNTTWCWWPTSTATSANTYPT
jgi:hypothetical protein